MRAEILVVFMLFGVLGARTSAAQDGVNFEYDAPPDCASAAEFRKRVQERLLGSTLEGREQRASIVRVRVEPAARRASVEFQDVNGARVTRAVQGDTCDELVTGVALITALAFGAQSTAAPASNAEVPAQPAQPAQPAKTDADAGTGNTAVKAAPRAATPKRPTALRQPKSNRPRARRSAAPAATEVERSEESAEEDAPEAPLGWDAGAGGWLSSWLSPTRTLGADLFVRLGTRRAGWSARISGLYGASSVYLDDRRADFSFLGGRLEGCPLAFDVLSSLAAEACVTAELGSLRGAGREDSALRVGGEQSVFWAAAAVVARLRAPVTRFAVLEIQGEFGLPISAHEFVFEDPEVEVFRVPSYGGAGRIGLAVPFL